MSLDSNMVAILTALITFVGTVFGSLVVWNKSNKDEKAMFRADIFKINAELRGDVTSLRARVDALESENTKHTKTVNELQTTIEKIRAALYTVLNEDLDDIMAKYNERIKAKKAES